MKTTLFIVFSTLIALSQTALDKIWEVKKIEPGHPDTNYFLKHNENFYMEINESLNRLFFGQPTVSTSFGKDGIDNNKGATLITGDEYRDQICNDDGTIVNKEPYLIYWPKFGEHWSNLPYISIHKLATQLKGTVKVRYADFYGDEKFRMTFEVYKPGRTYYIDEEGRAYLYPGMITVNGTQKWIENREFRNSPLQFKAPPIISDTRLRWADIKKDVRAWYDDNLRQKIEPPLRKIGLTYVVDMDPYDWDNIKLNQKRDRQIIFIVAGIVWILEFLWEQLTAPAPGAKKPAGKSFIDKQEGSKKAKEGREKIE